MLPYMYLMCFVLTQDKEPREKKSKMTRNKLVKHKEEFVMKATPKTTTSRKRTKSKQTTKKINGSKVTRKQLTNESTKSRKRKK